MKMGSMPIAVLMQRRTVRHRWADEAWEAVGVVPDRGDLPPLQVLSQTPERDYYLVSGLELELYPDENEGYYENCVAPESVSYVEGTRMFDSGENADGVTMPAEIYAWLAGYLREHYQPKPRRGRQHG